MRTNLRLLASLLLGVSVACGAQSIVNPGSSTGASQPVSVKDYGAVGDGAHMAADTAALKSATAQAAISGKSVYVPAGTYLLDNSTAAALSGAQNVHIFGDGPSSKLVCQTLANDCITSTGATGFAVDRLAISYGPAATTRSTGYALNISQCTHCAVTGVTLNNGNLSGIRLASSSYVDIRDTSISNFLANGIFSINNTHLHVNGLACTNNNDGCFEASYFDSQFTAFGTTCSDITVSNLTSVNDTIAVLINACKNVSVNGFTATNSGRSAVFVGQDPTTTTTQWPDRISISNGTITGSGYGTNFRNYAGAQALYVNVGTAPAAGVISHISFSNIVATHISSWGFQMAELNNDDVQLSNVRIDDAGSGNLSGCVLAQGNVVSLSNVTCSNAGTYSLDIQNTLNFTSSGFTSVNPNQVGSGTQAVLNATTGTVKMDGITLLDTHAGTNLSAMFDSTSSGDHTYTGIKMVGTVAPSAPTAAAGSAATFMYTDPTHPLVIKTPSTILSFNGNNVFVNTTSGATSSVYAGSPPFYYQSRCFTTSAQTESVGWITTFPTLSTESFSLTETGGCSFPIVFDVTKAATTVANAINATVISGTHLGGRPTSVPTVAPGTGAGTSPTLALNASSTDVSGYLSVTTGTAPVAGATVATLTFGTAYANLAKCDIWPANSAANALSGAGNFFAPVGSTTAFTISSGSTALAASTLYTLGYSCTQ